ncbi:hypothetical protein IL306_005120 [Fusarium sp. DS 682]|nr:hypothetical protein IL306_005120 [Fusarium sp. DS 682]
MNSASPPVAGPSSSSSNTGQSQRERIAKKEESSDDECVSINKYPVKMSDSKQAICLDDGDDESISQKAPITDNLSLVKEESDEDEKKSNMKLKPHNKKEITVDDFCNSIDVSQDPDDEDEEEDDSKEEMVDDDDLDFVDDEDSDDDSDDDYSDDSEAQAKRNKLKGDTFRIAKIQRRIKAMISRKNGLLVKKYEGTELTTEEVEKLQSMETQITESEVILANHMKPRGPVAKTAREYWKRQLEREIAKEERKRKRDDDGADPRKVHKTVTLTRPGGGHSAFSRAAALFTTNTEPDDDSDGPANEIKATTHASQMKQIMAGMPEGNDTRHTKTQARDLVEAKKCFGYKKVKAIDGNWKLKGMKTPLHSQQLVGASWMTMREAKGLHPAGGILADDMGMGKTITALATIIGHPHEPEDKKEGYCKATLIIADNPHSAMMTWMDQINKHALTKFANKCVIYSKSLGKPMKWWGNRNVVITHLNELRTQFLSKKEHRDLKGKWAGDDVGFQQALYRKLGPLFKIGWYRVILDEAHGIKSHTSTGALAVWHLTAKYNWALTGTPLFNKLEEFYPYLKFIGCRFTTTMKRFRAEYVRGDQAKENFDELVSLVMLRRKQTDKFLGRTMAPLPKSHRKDIWVPTSGWEKIHMKVVDDAYQTKLPDNQDENHETAAVEQEHEGQGNEDDSGAESEAEFEEGANDGSVAPNNYKVQKLRCMRLVQLTSHPLNLEKFYREDGREGQIQLTLDRFESEITQSSVKEYQKALEASLDPDYSAGLRQLELATEDKFGGAKEMAELLKLAANEKKMEDITCKLCRKRKPPVNPVQSSNCEHIYCKDCLIIAISGVTKTGRPLAPPECSHDECSAKLGLGRAVKTPACIDAAVKAIRGFKEPGRDSIGTRWTGGPKECASFFRAVCGRGDIDYGPLKMPLGSKVKATLAVTLTWMQQAPDDKIISCVLESMGIKFVYYNRMANKRQKARALDEFANNPDIKILVSSMKCGGQSFNLQMANRTIIVDEWWNLAVEEQAFRRVFRTGQLKETYLVRIMAKDTLDERIIMLQNAKEAIIKAALQDEEMQPHFSGDLQLRMLFSTKDEQSLITEMGRETRAQQANQ